MAAANELGRLAPPRSRSACREVSDAEGGRINGTVAGGAQEFRTRVGSKKKLEGLGIVLHIGPQSRDRDGAAAACGLEHLETRTAVGTGQPVGRESICRHLE
jgi:hypothetical protein